jgi:hypothetical protein
MSTDNGQTGCGLAPAGHPKDSDNALPRFQTSAQPVGLAPPLGAAPSPSRIEGIAMSTIEKLLAQKQQLMEQLASEPGPNEREEIQRLLAKIETALTLLEPDDPVGRGE